MKKLRISFLAIILLLFFYANLNAQNALTAVGGDIQSDNGSASYTVGQLVYTQKSDSHNTALEGVQQPYEISIISGVDGAEIQPIEAQVYDGNEMNKELQQK